MGLSFVWFSKYVLLVIGKLQNFGEEILTYYHDNIMAVITVQQSCCVVTN